MGLKRDGLSSVPACCRALFRSGLAAPGARRCTKSREDQAFPALRIVRASRALRVWFGEAGK